MLVNKKEIGRTIIIGVWSNYCNINIKGIYEKRGKMK